MKREERERENRNQTPKPNGKRKEKRGGGGKNRETKPRPSMKKKKGDDEWLGKNTKNQRTKQKKKVRYDERGESRWRVKWIRKDLTTHKRWGPLVE